MQCQFDADRDLIIYPAGIPLPSPNAPSNPVSSSRNPKLPASSRTDTKRPFPIQNSPVAYGTGYRPGGMYQAGGSWYAGAWNGGIYDPMGPGPKDWYGGGGYPPAGRPAGESRWPKSDSSRSSHGFASSLSLILSGEGCWSRSDKDKGEKLNAKHMLDILLTRPGFRSKATFTYDVQPPVKISNLFFLSF